MIGTGESLADYQKRKEQEDKLKQQNQVGVGTVAGIGASLGLPMYAARTGQSTLQATSNIAKGAWDVTKGVGGATGGLVKNAMPSATEAIAGTKALAKATPALGGLGLTAFNTWNTDTEQYRDRFGLKTDDPSLLGDIGVRTLGAMSDLGNVMTFGQASKLYQDSNIAKWNPEQAPQAIPQNKVTTIANPMNSPAQNKPTSWGDDPEMQKMFSGGKTTIPISQAEADQLTKPVVSTDPKTGKANLDVFGNPASPFAPIIPVGTKVEKFEMPDIKPPTQAELAMRALQNVGSNMKTPSVGMPFAPSRGYEERIARENLLADANTVIKGARGLTANQLRVKADLSQGDDKLKQDVYNQQMAMAQAQLRENGDMQKAVMNEQGQNARAMLNEAGTNERSQAGLGLDMEKLRQSTKMEEAKLGLDMNKFKQEMQNSDIQNYGTNRLNNLQSQYDNAKTDEERKAIADKANATLGGKSAGVSKDDFITLGGGQQWDANAQAVISNPQQLYNIKTGQTIGVGGGQPTNNQPKAGQVINGYKFKGGDPANQNNWEKA